MQSISKSLVLASVSALGLLTEVSSAAQTVPATSPGTTAEANADDEAIIVTGSRLRRDPNATAPLPISTLNAEDFRNAGNTDVTATLRQIPALISSSTVADSIERGPAGTVGQATLNLRQLGSARTLVLVDGWRHVSGLAGTQTVDVSTIPGALIERVEVLTGGASAIYGADAVTGVVNYVLRRDFDGISLNAQSGISAKGDGQSYRIEGTIGKNFAEGRGNVTFSAGYTNDAEILMGDRDRFRDNGRANNNRTYQNPDRRFQQGEINPTNTPNFAARYRLGGPGTRAEDFPFGVLIPAQDQIATLFPGGITAAEQALVDRAANAPLFAIRPNSGFSISSNSGIIFRGDFGTFGADVNRNGISDCTESFQGRFGLGGGGCYVSGPGGEIRLYRDGVIAGTQNQFGGDVQQTFNNRQSLIPGSERINANLRASFEFAPAARVWFDAKYARNNTTTRDIYNTFYDSLYIFPDNPFIPAVLQADATEGGGLRISRDFLDLGPGIDRYERDTYRIVGGIDGEITSHLKYELVANYGRSDNTEILGNQVLYDRLFAATDVVRGANGQPVCRSNIDPTALHPGSEFFPVINPGFFSFSPGAASGCVPVNLFNGINSVTPAAVDWITTTTTDRARIEQLVFTGILTGDTGGFFNLPGGPIQFAVGGEYRREKSRFEFNSLRLGILPTTTPAGPAGSFIGDLPQPPVDGFPPAEDVVNQSLLFDPNARVLNSGGSFDVKEVFGEFSLPILKDTPFFHELSLGAAGRYADYSTTGGAFTWNVNGIWAPIRDVRIRGTYSRAIRSPNIGELFDPEQGQAFNPNDPCDGADLAAFVASGAPGGQNRLANCRADGLGPTFDATSSGRFIGVDGGNPNLDPERATTWTVGAVLQPRFLPGLTLSADYYSIEIRDAIQAVPSQQIVDTCYDSTTFPNDFCALFSRNPSTRRINFLRQTVINFAKLETSGIDFQADYRFSLGKNNIALHVSGNWTEKLNRFFDPVDQGLVNPGLGELGAPEWSGYGSITYSRGAFSLNYGVQYVKSTAAASIVEIENERGPDVTIPQFGPSAFAPDYFIHSASFNFDVTEQLSFYGGINNLTDAEPYISSSAYPVSGIGRFYFLGARTKF